MRFGVLNMSNNNRMSPFFPNHKHYHTLHSYYLRKFGERVWKASLDAGCTCPNRDGAVGISGCIFCENGSRYFTGNGSVMEQLAAEQLRIHKKWPKAKLIAYFQAGTNTYGSLPELVNTWEEVIRYPDVVGIAIATRADCLGNDVLKELERLNQSTYLTVELGLQTVHDCTAERIGRGHDFACFLRGFKALQSMGIRVCVHLIDGLPGETFKMMIETAEQVGHLCPDGVKIHLLHVNRGTPLEALWEQGDYVPLEKTDYVELVTEQLRYFPPETVIERLTGDGDRNVMLAPLWSRDKIAVLGAIDQRMVKKQIFQGDRFGIEN